MEKLRYNKSFKCGMCCAVLCLMLCGIITTISIVSRLQYDKLVENMEAVEATIVDIDLDVHLRGPDVQEITITYEVDGVVYNRELDTDTKVSFAAGSGANYSVGDRVKIFYDPQNPEVIASPRTVVVGYFYLAIGLIGLAFFGWLLFHLLKRHRSFLVTQAEYEKEKEALKKSKIEAKKQKKALREERRRKYSKILMVLRVILTVLGALLGAFILIGVLVKIF